MNSVFLSVFTPVGIAFRPVWCHFCWETNVSVFVCVWLAGDRGEQGDKGSKGYGLPGYTGDQGPKGKFIFQYLMLFDDLVKMRH